MKTDYCNICECDNLITKCKNCNYILCDVCYNNYFVVYKNKKCPHCRLDYTSKFNNDNLSVSISISENSNMRGIFRYNEIRLFERLKFYNFLKMIFIISSPLIFSISLYFIGMIVTKFILKLPNHNNIGINIFVGIIIFSIFFIFILLPIMIIFQKNAIKLFRRI